MTLVELVGFFVAVPHGDRDAILPGQYRYGDSEMWPLAATAAVRLAGCGDASDPAGLLEGVEHFQALLAIGVVDGRQWWDEVCEVAEALDATLAAGVS